MVAVAAFPERLIAVYEGVTLGLDLPADSGGRQILAGPVRLGVTGPADGIVVLGCLYTHPLARGRGCASAALRGLCDVADRRQWTLVTDPAAAVGGDPARAVRLFARFAFTGDAGVHLRLPARAWYALA